MSKPRNLDLFDMKFWLIYKVEELNKVKDDAD
jgi:hypothetical protein